MILLIDSNAICHQAKHSMKDLGYQGENTGVIFGFMSQIHKYAKQFKTNKFVFAWDSRKSFREEIYPEYKALRKKKKEDKPKEEILFDQQSSKQFDRIRDKILPSLGFKNNLVFSGLEADDIIASITQCYPKDQFVIISGDNDLFQLLTDNVSLYSPFTKKLYTPEVFREEFNISCKLWSEVKSIAGCSTDEVPAVAVGIAEKTAIKYLNNELKKTTKAYQKIKEGKEIIRRNRKLVELPFERTPGILIQENEKLSLDAFLRICNENGFASMLQQEKLRSWKEVIGLQ